MKETLYINGVVGKRGVRMGEGFIDTLSQPLTYKEFISNESRLEDGKRVITNNKKVASRTFSLTFNIHGDTRTDFLRNKEWLFKQLARDEFVLGTDCLTSDGGMIYFHLVYTGKSITYAENISHTVGKVTIGFEEPNPTNREI